MPNLTFVRMLVPGICKDVSPYGSGDGGLGSRTGKNSAMAF